MCQRLSKIINLMKQKKNEHMRKVCMEMIKLFLLQWNRSTKSGSADKWGRVSVHELCTTSHTYTRAPRHSQRPVCCIVAPLLQSSDRCQTERIFFCGCLKEIQYPMLLACIARNNKKKG